MTRVVLSAVASVSKYSWKGTRQRYVAVLLLRARACWVLQCWTHVGGGFGAGTGTSSGAGEGDGGITTTRGGAGVGVGMGVGTGTGVGAGVGTGSGTGLVAGGAGAGPRWRRPWGGVWVWWWGWWCRVSWTLVRQVPRVHRLFIGLVFWGWGGTRSRTRGRAAAREVGPLEGGLGDGAAGEGLGSTGLGMSKTVNLMFSLAVFPVFVVTVRPTCKPPGEHEHLESWAPQTTC